MTTDDKLGGDRPKTTDELDAADEFYESLIKPKLCSDCGLYPADLPSHICPGCEAYREHTAI